jgi:CHAT domain-containing protein
MTQRIEWDETKTLTQKRRHQPLRLGLVCGSFSIFISILSLSGFVGEASGHTSVKVAQQPASTTSKDKLAEAERLLKEGRKFYEQKTEAALKQALEKYQQALLLYRAGNDKLGEGKALANIGLAYSDLGDQQQALNYYNQALPLFQALDNKHLEAVTIFLIGQSYFKLGDPQQALNYYDRALPFWRTAGKKEEELEALFSIGRAYSALDRGQEALSNFNQALELLKSQAKNLSGSDLVSNRSKQAGILFIIGLTYRFQLKDRQQAIAFYEKALKIRQELGERAQTPKTLDEIASVYKDLQEPEKALAAYSQLLEIQQAQKDLNGEANTLNSIAGIYNYKLGQPEKALATYNRLLAVYNQLLKIQQAEKDLNGQVSTLDSIARIYKDNLNQPEKALAAYNQQIQVYKQLLKIQQAEKDLDGQTRTLTLIALVYKGLKKPEKALAIYNQLLEIQQRQKNFKGQADTLREMAQIYDDNWFQKTDRSLNQPQQALAIYNQLLEIQQAQKDLEGQIRTLRSIANIHQYLKESQQKLTAYNQILMLSSQLLEIQRTQKDLKGQIITLEGMGRIYEALKQPQKELATDNQRLTVYNQLLEIQQAKKDLVGQAETLQEMAQIYEGGFLRSSLNEPQQALSVYNRLLEIQQKQKDLEGQILTLKKIISINNDLKETQREVAAYDQIIGVYNQLLEVQQAKKNVTGQINTLTEIARIYQDDRSSKYSKLVQPQKALNIYKQILEIQQKNKDLDGQAFTLLTIADLYQFRLSQPKKALVTYKQALKIKKQQKDLYWQAIFLDRIGEVYDSQKQRQQARISFTQAINNYKQVLERLGTETPKPSGLQFDRAWILSRIAEEYGKLGDAPNTLYYGIQADELRLAEEKDLEAKVKKLYAMSDKYQRFGKRQKALDTLNRAIKIQQQTQDNVGQADTLRLFAEVYNRSSEPQKALDLLNQVLATQEKIQDRAGQINTLSDIAQIYRSLGDYAFSKDSYSRALVVAKQTGDIYQQVNILSALGIVYRDEEQYEKALAFYLQALAINRSIKDDRRNEPYPGFKREVSESTVQLGIASSYAELRDVSKANIAANRAIELSRNTGFWNGPAYAYTMMGKGYLKQGSYQKALNAFEKALPDLKKNQTPSTDATVLNFMGEAYVGLKQYPKAIETYNFALERFQQKWGDRKGEAETRYLIAVAERDRGNLKAARTQIEAALKVVEDFRGKVIDQQLRTSYFTSVQKYYEFYIDLLMQLHKRQPSKGFSALALQASERARARSLLDLLNESQTDVRQGVDPKLLDREKDLQLQLNTLEKRRIEFYSKPRTKVQTANPKPEDDTPSLEKPNFEQEYNTLSAQYRDLQTQIRANSPRYAALTQPQPLKLTDIQQQVLDDRTVLLEYFLGKERSYLWVVTKSEITSYELPKESKIETAIRQFRQVLTKRTARHSDISQAGTPLSQMLLGSVAKQLGQKRLLIVSNGALQYLPFAALPSPTGSGFLLSEHEIINLPSASTLATLRKELNGRKPAPKTFAVFADPVFSQNDDRVTQNKGRPTPGNPNTEPFSVQILRDASEEVGVDFERLKGTRQEAQDIVQLLPANTRTQALDFEANKSNVLNSKLSQYRIIHFATHGVLNTSRPELSAVVLSLVDRQGRPENGFLRLNDIFNLNLPSELVVLSACETGLGQNIRGEGLVGLTRGFMYAGTPRVLASLWSVDDKSTAILMTRFYKAMLEKGLPPAAALRTAQLELQKEEKWQSPYYWSAFTIQGEWK